MYEWRLATGSVPARYEQRGHPDGAEMPATAPMDSQRGALGRVIFFGARKMGLTNSTFLAAVLLKSANRSSDHELRYFKTGNWQK